MTSVILKKKVRIFKLQKSNWDSDFFNKKSSYVSTLYSILL